MSKWLYFQFGEKRFYRVERWKNQPKVQQWSVDKWYWSAWTKELFTVDFFEGKKILTKAEFKAKTQEPAPTFQYFTRSDVSYQYWRVKFGNAEYAETWSPLRPRWIRSRFSPGSMRDLFSPFSEVKWADVPEEAK